MIFVLFVIIILYCLAIIALIYGFSKVISFNFIGLKPKTKFSIIVPFRNEAENLPVFLDSLSKLNYPMNRFEVILVDDDSEERVQITDCRHERQRTGEALQISVLRNIRVSNSPKKDAISTAMKMVKNEWIITTDADCIVNEDWLTTLDNYIQKNTVSMIAGAVTYDCDASFLHYFQQLDLASLQGATIGSFGLGNGFMCNGANFAYTKSFFKELNGFDGNDKIASGDDVFLLQKAMARFPEKVHYLKSRNSIVRTKPMNDWKSLFYQRVRWASKTKSYKSSFGKALGLIVFAGNLVLVWGVGCWVLGFISLANIVLLSVLKFVLDAVLIYQANYFLTKNSARYLIMASFLYPFFSVSVAFYSLFGNYDWKGRKF